MERAGVPPAGKVGRLPKWAKRQLIDGIRWWVGAGAPWRDAPLEYGLWQSVCGLFCRSQLDATWPTRPRGSAANRAWLRCHGIRCIIPEKKDDRELEEGQ